MNPLLEKDLLRYILVDAKEEREYVRKLRLTSYFIAHSQRTIMVMQVMRFVAGDKWIKILHKICFLI